MSDIFIPTSSDNLHPVANNNSINALSLVSLHAKRNLSISSTVREFLRRLGNLT